MICYIMRYVISLLAAMLFAGCADAKELPRLFEYSDFKEVGEGYVNNGYPPEMIAQKTVNLGKNIDVNARIELTKRRNGYLCIANLADLDVKVFDGDNNGETYAGEFLFVSLSDLDGDGYLDLIVFGVKEIWDEKGDEIIARRPEFKAWRFDPEAKKFANPFGIFDPYSTCRNYYSEITIPEHRIVLPAKYLSSHGPACDRAMIQPENFAKPLTVVYGIRIESDGKASCILNIDGREF